MLQVIAACYDNPIPGYGTNTVGNLRLWESRPVTEFKLDEFNEGHYVEVKLCTLVHVNMYFQLHLQLETHSQNMSDGGVLLQAVDEKRKAEDISSVLYPNDATEYGKELRLKQQFFFVSASIQVSFRSVPSFLLSVQCSDIDG